MEQTVPFEEGSYLAERAFLVAHNDAAVAIDEVVINVFYDNRRNRQMNGAGFIENYLLVQMHEESDEMDLLLDMGGEFKYTLKNPILQSGKVFTPGVKASLKFTPTRPLEPIPASEFDARAARLRFATD
ncbi:MAG: hypothetical protein GY859_12040 [Desulfobacterales bacterium]|nr:hypothetical protein [Desulfobacterales bacterium]